MRPSATSVSGLNLLVHEALSYECMETRASFKHEAVETRASLAVETRAPFQSCFRLAFI